MICSCTDEAIKVVEAAACNDGFTVVVVHIFYLAKVKSIMMGAHGPLDVFVRNSWIE